MRGARWADDVEAEQEGGQKEASTRPISVPLGHAPERQPKPTEKMVSFCVRCTAAFYQPGAERIHKHCGECYREWAARKYGPKPLRRVTTSPTSSRTASSGDTAEDCAVLRDLEVEQIGALEHEEPLLELLAQRRVALVAAGALEEVRREGVARGVAAERDF